MHRLAGSSRAGQLPPIQPSTAAGRGKAGLLAPGALRVVGVPSPRSWGTFSCLDHLATVGRSPAGWAPPKQGSPPWAQLSMPGGQALTRCLCPCSGDRVPAQTLTLQLTERLHPGLGKAAPVPVATMELRSDLASPEVPLTPPSQADCPRDPQLQAEATVSRVGWPALFLE